MGLVSVASTAMLAVIFVIVFLSSYDHVFCCYSLGVLSPCDCISSSIYMTKECY